MADDVLEIIRDGTAEATLEVLIPGPAAGQAGRSVRVPIFFPGAYLVNECLYVLEVPDDCTLSELLSECGSLVAPTTDFVVAIRKSTDNTTDPLLGTTWGTFTVLAGERAGSADWPDGALVAGNVLAFIAPGTLDATQAGFFATLRGTT
jgi:hypothetical protein